jgi:hypothetical protein
MATLTAALLVKDTTTPTSYPLSAAQEGEAFTDASSFDVAFPEEGKLLLRINSTLAGAGTVVIGATQDYLGKGVGTLTVVTAQNGVYYLPLSSSRFKDFDGTVRITFGTSNTGFISAFTIP